MFKTEYPCYQASRLARAVSLCQQAATRLMLLALGSLASGRACALDMNPFKPSANERLESLGSIDAGDA